MRAFERSRLFWRRGGAGALTLPHVGTLQAVLTELEGGQEPRENFVRYRFTFVEAA